MISLDDLISRRDKLKEDCTYFDYRLHETMGAVAAYDEMIEKVKEECSETTEKTP